MYKQNPKSPLAKAMTSKQKMVTTPAKQTTAGEFAYEKHRKDMEMGKATYPSDKARAAFTSMTSDNVTYKDAKKELRKKHKEEYNAKNPKSPAKQAKRVSPSELSKSSYKQNSIDNTSWSYTGSQPKSTTEPSRGHTAPHYKRSNVSSKELSSMPAGRRLDTIRAQENANYMSSKGVAGLETMSDKDVNKTADKLGYSSFTQGKVKERFSGIKSTSSPAMMKDPVTGNKVKGYAKENLKVDRVRDRQERKETKTSKMGTAKSDGKVTRLERQGIRESQKDLKNKQVAERNNAFQKQKVKDKVAKEGQKLRNKRTKLSDAVAVGYDKSKANDKMDKATNRADKKVSKAKVKAKKRSF